VRHYLDAHRFANTETADLWNAIEEASGEPVRDIMDTFIFQGGFPLVTVDDAPGPTPPAGTTVVSQAPFQYADADGPSAIGSTWKVPVIARAIGGGEARVLLGEAPEPVELTGDGPDRAVVVNAGGSGFYRVRYALEHQRRLAGRLDELDLLERFNLLGDSWATVVGQLSSPTDFLVLAEALGDEDDPNVWAQVTGALSLLDRTTDDDARPLVGSYTRALLRPVLARLGWTARPDEGPRTPTLRSQVVATLGTVGHDPDVQAESHQLHDAAQRGELTLDPDLASAILSAVAASGGPEDFEAFLEHYRHPATPQEEMRYLYALASFSDPLLAARAFELALSEVRTQNAPFVIQMLLASRDNGPATWERVREHWDELVTRIPSNIVPRMLGGVTSLCRDPHLALEVTTFVRDHPLPVGGRTVDQTLERLGINVSFAASLRETAVPVLSAGRRRLEKN
jgi:puromycin-sensitive aminopeptidase